MTYRLSAIWSMVGRISGDVVAIEALRGFEAHVVVAGLVVLAEAELSSGCEQ